MTKSDLVAYVNRRNAADLERDADLLSLAIALLQKRGSWDVAAGVQKVQDAWYSEARNLYLQDHD